MASWSRTDGGAWTAPPSLVHSLRGVLLCSGFWVDYNCQRPQGGSTRKCAPTSCRPVEALKTTYHGGVCMAENTPQGSVDARPGPLAYRVLICGSRTWSDPIPIVLLVRGLAHGPRNLTIISGGANGADRLAARSARRQNIPLEEYPADWRGQGKSAGAIRNQRMLDEGKPDVVWAFVDKPLVESRGTADMVRRARKAGIKTFVVTAHALGEVA